MSEPDVESLLPQVPVPRTGDPAAGEGEPGPDTVPASGDVFGESAAEPGGDLSREPVGGTRRHAGWSRGARLPGAPARRSRALPALIAFAVLLGGVAGFVARGFVSPAQQAAQAQAPPPSLITAPVRYGVLPVLVAMRANVSSGHSLAVSGPGDLAGSLAVVTSVGVRSGQDVGQGQLLVTVAERPVFMFQGKIPAFRTMAPGLRGPDVAQLQAGLAAAGFGTGSDPSGLYGPGTAAAVAALYKAHGLRAASAPPPKTPTHSKRPPSAEIPLGEALFVPHLPVRVGSVDRLGASVGSGKSVATLVSGRATLTAFAGPAQVSLLRPGMTGTAISDFTGQNFPVRIAAIHGPQVVYIPVGRLPSGVAGQNVEVTVTTSRVQTFIVPVAAVSTAGTGQTYVTVATGKGNQTTQVPVRLGLVSGGEQAVTPVRPGGLRSGELVVLGLATSAKSKSKSSRGPQPGPGISVKIVPGPG